MKIKDTQLPIEEVIPQIQAKLTHANCLIVKAPPGAGKSTLLPLALLDAPWLKGQKILMLEPRRLAAKSIANRMADLLGETVGKTVGYRIRFETRTSQSTRIEVLTEGILTRMLQSDNALEGVGMVVFDEFHERSLFADVALALCREAQQVLRPDLRMLIMSATLDLQKLADMLHAPVVESKGRQYPVEIKYAEKADVRLLAEFCAQAVIKATQTQAGDVLVFLPGQAEILKCENLLKAQLPDFAIHPLYGQLPQHKQQAAILPNRLGKRKVVLATSIAETSLTIEGITVVVDSGYGRYQQFDPNSGLTRLETARISQDAADQRAGRAGRLSEGVCYRLWTKFDELDSHRMPEIEQADLANLALDLANWGVHNPLELAWLSPPPQAAFAQARETLHQLEALADNAITAHGKQMLRLPCHPRIAHMLLMAKDMDMLALATDIAAVVEERDFLPKDAGVNINLRIEALRRYRQSTQKGKRIEHIERIAHAYRQLFDQRAENHTVDEYETGFLLSQAYPERIAASRPGNNAQFQLANGKIAFVGKQDELAYEQWLAVAHIDARAGLGKIFMASPLNPKDLAPLVKEKENIGWDSEEGGIVASKDLCIGSIVLRSIPIDKPDERAKNNAIFLALKKEGKQLLDFSEEVEQWQARVLSLRKWQHNMDWPDVSTPQLLAKADAWLSPYLQGIRKTQQLKRLNLLEILQASLAYEQQTALDKDCPTRLEVPSGSKIKIKYLPNGETPVLAVRLQEVFGLAETPRINQGRTPLLMHLLSPGFKPVQVTSDLSSFWNNAYFEVRKELKRRYPKHAWPDNPWEAEAVRGVRRRK